MKKLSLIPVLIGMLLCSISVSLPAQELPDSLSVVAENEETGRDSILIKLDSLLERRFARIDSIAKELTGNTSADADTLASSGGEAQQTLAHIEEVVSWQKIVMLVLFFILTYYITVFASKILDNFSERISKYRLRIKRMVPIFRVIIWILAIYIAVAGIIQPPYATIITVLASVGIAVGLAAQDVLKNLFGGIMLILDRPFQVGDKIQFADYYGEVKQIGLRSSRIVTPGDSVVTIPNGELIRTAVSNANTGDLDCQVITEIFLPAQCNVEEVKEIAYKAVVSSRYVYMAKPISLITENEMHQRRSMIKLKVKAYVLDIRFEFPFQSDVTEIILSELNRRGIIRDEEPVPQKTVETE